MKGMHYLEFDWSCGRTLPKDDNAVVTVPSSRLVKTCWEIGGAVKTDSRDLTYAVADAVTALNTDGGPKAICETYGVTYTPPKRY